MSKGLPLQQQRVNPLQNEDDTQDKEEKRYKKLISIRDSKENMKV